MYATTTNLPAVQPVRSRRTGMRVRRARTLRVLGVLLVALAVLVFAPKAVHMMGRTELPATRTYTVAPGDTLWDIASTYSGNQDIRKVVAAIKRTNGLTGSVVQPGQPLEIPKFR